VFDFDTATTIMRDVDEANRRLGLDEEDEDAEFVSYNPDQDAFLVGHADGPIAFHGYDIDAVGERIHVYPLATRYWTWVEVERGSEPVT
jgi:hypothetical protein